MMRIERWCFGFIVVVTAYGALGSAMVWLSGGLTSADVYYLPLLDLAPKSLHEEMVDTVVATHQRVVRSSYGFGFMVYCLLLVAASTGYWSTGRRNKLETGA